MDPRIAALEQDLPDLFEVPKKPVDGIDDDFVIVEIASEGDDVDAEVGGWFGEEVEDISSDPSDPDLIDAGVVDIGPYRGDLPEEVTGYELGPVTELKWPRILGQVRRRVGGDFPGSPYRRRTKPINRSLVPPPDALAFYLPFHAYPDYWGIYLIAEGVNTLGSAILYVANRVLGGSLTRHEAFLTAKAYLWLKDDFQTCGR
tara:strand:+ start:244 stop:849 length:606 start_codon:yes stop_codon:yes gene_type:complete